MKNPERKSKIEPGIGDVPGEGIYGISATDWDLLEVNWARPEGGGITKGKFLAGLGAVGGLLFLAGCTSAEATKVPTEKTQVATETTGIPPAPEITPIPTEIPAIPTKESTPTKIPTPEPTFTPTPEAPTPVPTVTVEAAGYGGWTVDEQEKANKLRTLYEAKTEGMWGTIYITHGDEYGEIGAYFDKENRGSFWLLVGREGKEILEKVPPLMGTSLAWNPNEVRFEYQPQGVPNNWIWQPKERMVYDPINGINVAQWNPETSSWDMNPPEPEPENWTYIEGVEHVKFAGFNQEQLQMLKEAADLVKQYDSERFALFEREIDWVIFHGEQPNLGGRHKIWVSSYNFEPMLSLYPREIANLFLAGMIWGHEFEHSIQAMEGRDFTKTCQTTGRKVIENEAVKAQVNLLKKLRQGITKENQSRVEPLIAGMESKIDKNCTW